MTARPRGEQGFIRREGKAWIGFWHEYDSPAPGAKRLQKRRKLGDVASMNRFEARQALTKLLAREQSGGLQHGAAVADAWALHQRKYERTSGGQAATMRSLYDKHIKPRFGAAKLASVKPADVEQFFDQMAGFSESLRDKARVLLRALFARAVEEGIITRSPMADAYIRIESAGPQAALTAAEVRAIRAELADEEDRIKFDLCWMLGLDRSALRALRLDDITPDGLRIDEGRVEGKETRLKTKRRHATVALPRDLQDRLSLLADGSRRWLFPAIKGAGPFDAAGWLADVLRPACERAGVAKRVDFRMLRRTAGTLLQQAGAKPQAAAGVLRNSAEITLRHYTDTSHRAEQAAALEASWARVMETGRLM